MAKGSAMGLWKGKKGSNVFYKLKNSNNAQKQGVRERIYDVSNPQTDAQANQRMKLLPACRLAATLKDVVERGFEGVKYGAMSRQEFMRYALAMTSGYPATDRNATIVYPGRYLVSKGSLPTMAVAIDSGVGANFTCASLYTDDDSVNTIGDLASALLEFNTFLKKGDQLTIVAAQQVNDPSIEAPIVWMESSIYLDPESTESLPKLWNGFDLDDNSHMRFGVTDNFAWFVACTVILSRESASGNHLRSTQELVVSSNFNYLFTETAYNNARPSYQKKGSGATTDWPVDDSEEPVSGGGGSADLITTATIASVSNIVKWAADNKPILGYIAEQPDDDPALYHLAILSNGDQIGVTSGKTLAAWGISSIDDMHELTSDEKAALIAAGYTVSNLIWTED